MSTATTTPVFLTSDDVAARLQVARTTVRTLVATKGLPAYRVGRRLRFIEPEVDAWVAARNEAQPEPDYMTHVRALVDQAPELTDEAVDRIRAILAPVLSAAS